jgi:hypothetical protein
MKRFISSVVFALTIFTATAGFAQSPLPAESNKPVPANTASDTVAVQHVIDAYHEAILTHDGSRLASLFLPKGSTWLNVLSDPLKMMLPLSLSYERRSKNRPQDAVGAVFCGGAKVVLPHIW